jgi:cytidine deaminase
MAAITNAARRGVNIADNTLYTTTFPCHNCARHIIATGLSKVVYIEPYAKSLAAAFHNEALEVDQLPAKAGGDSVSVGQASEENRRVQCVPFVGVSPRLFMTLFAMRKRKDDSGKILLPDRKSAVPRHELVPNHLPYSRRESTKARDLLLAYQTHGVSLTHPLTQSPNQT